MPLPDGVAWSWPGLRRRISASWSWLVKKKPRPRGLRSAPARHRRWHGEVQILAAPLRLQQIQQRREQEGVVVEVGVQVRLAVLVRRLQGAVAPQHGAQELERAPGRVQHSGRSNTRAACAIPSIISAFQEVRIFSRARGGALLAPGQQLGACRLQHPRVLRWHAQRAGHLLQRTRDAQMPMVSLEGGASSPYTATATRCSSGSSTCATSSRDQT